MSSEKRARTGVAARKIEALRADGYHVNGVSLIHEGTGRRGIVDDLGFCGWLSPPAHEKAVEALIADGWTWDGAQWVRPVADDVVRSAVARAIGCGYSRGHHDTVEGLYVDVSYADRVEHHGELADDLLTGDSDFGPLQSLRHA